MESEEEGEGEGNFKNMTISQQSVVAVEIEDKPEELEELEKPDQ